MYLIASEMSCGIEQLIGLNRATIRDVKDTFIDYLWEHGERKVPFGVVVFSDRASLWRPGPRLAAQLEKLYPGTVWESPVATNPNHNSRIRLWYWTLPKEFIKEVEDAAGERGENMWMSSY